MSTEPTSRVQLALNVSDLDAAVDHYSRLFDTIPNKRKPGYANFVVADPPLKLVLFENPAQPGTLNHLGTEMADPAKVATTARRLQSAGIDATVDEAQECCFATQDKAWTSDPDGLPWEIYTVIADSDEFGHDTTEHGRDQVGCCGPEIGAGATAGTCCA